MACWCTEPTPSMRRIRQSPARWSSFTVRGAMPTIISSTSSLERSSRVHSRRRSWPRRVLLRTMAPGVATPSPRTSSSGSAEGQNDGRQAAARLTNARTTSFDVADELLRKLARKDIFPNLRSIVFAGHSAGGQFVSRYEMSNQVHETLGVPITYVVANPSSYAYLDDLRPSASALPQNVWSAAPGYVAPPSATPRLRSSGSQTPATARPTTSGPMAFRTESGIRRSSPTIS